MNRIPYISLLLTFLFFLSCKDDNNNDSPGGGGVVIDPQDSTKTLTIFYTNDEHGWMERTGEFNGAAGLSGAWKSEDNYENSLILSGGDMWTGPAISTWFKGKSMVEVMNKMGYDAAALGNHEFDFMVSELNKRKLEMDFPILAANVKEKNTNNIPDFVLPYVIKEVNGIKVGIIGLATTSTPWTTFPDYVEDYKFTSYSEAIEEYAPIMKNEGADISIVIGHTCLNAIESVTAVAKANDILLMGGGHCNEKLTKFKDDVLIISGGSKMQSYVKVDIEYNFTTKKATINNQDIINNKNTNIDSEVLDIVNHWAQQEDEELAEEIGYCSHPILKPSAEMGNMITDAWLFTFDDVDISFTNSGGIRQNIPTGPVTLGTIVGVLPFNNELYKLEIKGNELTNEANKFLMGGMTIVDGFHLSDGTPIHPDSTYTILITDFVYSLTNNNFSVYDPTPETTSLNWREPVINWIRSLNSNQQNPINNHLDYVSRR